MTARLVLADDSSISPLQITARSTEPTAPSTNDTYLDDGTNTASGQAGLRQYDGANWVDLNGAVGGLSFGAAAIKTLVSGVATLGSDRNVAIAAETGTTDDLIELAGLTVGESVIVYADTGDTITVKHNDAGATDKILLSGAADLALSGNQALTLTKIAAAKVVQSVDQNSGGVGGGGGDVVVSTFNARLTLTSGTPVTTTDVTAAGTLYLTPFRGNQIALYDGTAWAYHALTEKSLSLTLTDATNYDIFVYDNAGVLTLEAVAWTTATTRATALALQDGIYCKSGALTKRYVGTIRASGTNITEDSREKRFVWNLYNQTPRLLRRPLGNVYNYGTNTWRQAAGDASNKVSVIVGLPTFVRLTSEIGLFTGGAGRILNVSIGLGNTTPASDGGFVEHYSSSSELASTAKPTLHHVQLQGYQEYWALEKASATGSFSNGNVGVIVGHFDG